MCVLVRMCVERASVRSWVEGRGSAFALFDHQQSQALMTTQMYAIDALSVWWLMCLDVCVCV